MSCGLQKRFQPKLLFSQYITVSTITVNRMLKNVFSIMFILLVMRIEQFLIKTSDNINILCIFHSEKN